MCLFRVEQKVTRHCCNVVCTLQIGGLAFLVYKMTTRTCMNTKMLKNCNFWNYKWDYWRRLIAMHSYDGNKISSLQRCHFFNQCFRCLQQWTKVYDPGRLPLNKWVCFSTWRGVAFPANFSLWNWFWLPSIFASYFFFLCQSDLVYFTFAACVACHLLFLSSYFPSS